MKNSSNKYNIILLAVGVVVIAVICFLIFGTSKTKTDEGSTEALVTEQTTNMYSTYGVGNETVQIEPATISNDIKVNKIIDTYGISVEALRKEWDSFSKNKSIYYSCKKPDSGYSINMTNSSNETFEQGSDQTYIAVYTNNGEMTCIMETADVPVVHSIGYSPLGLVEFSIVAAERSLGHFKYIDVSNDNKKTYRFAVDICGYGDIAKFYGIRNNSFGVSMASYYKEAFSNLMIDTEEPSETVSDETETLIIGDTNTSEETTEHKSRIDTSKMNLRMLFTIDGESGISEIAFQCYFGDERGFDSDIEINTFWYIDRFWYVDNWELDRYWYGDFSNVSNSDEKMIETAEKASELSSMLGEMITKYIIENYELLDGVDVIDGTAYTKDDVKPAESAKSKNKDGLTITTKDGESSLTLPTEVDADGNLIMPSSGIVNSK